MVLSLSNHWPRKNDKKHLCYTYVIYEELVLFAVKLKQNYTLYSLRMFTWHGGLQSSKMNSDSLISRLYLLLRDEIDIKR